MHPIIEINKLGKEYSVSAQQRYLALRDVISGYFSKKQKQTEAGSFWALKDITLKVEAGEKVGIIGANGAGKSTLLKIISRITPPTSGTAVLRGRVGSLLEVGTGFHPELTGYENIFMNGSILGMRRKEISKKLDEIINFSGVEKYIHTPLKHYSSGMQLRLAFSVAAHLEPEILLIDEVLAVGDLEFQRKCIGKMEEINKNQGRTILFVSHNLSAINNFCNKTVLLEKGMMRAVGKTDAIVNEYILSHSETNAGRYIAGDTRRTKSVFIKTAEMQSADGRPLHEFKLEESIIIDVSIQKQSSDTIFDIGVAVNDINEKRIAIDHHTVRCTPEPCTLHCRISIPAQLMTPNDYSIDLALIKQGSETLDIEKNITRFRIIKTNTKFESLNYDYGYINQSFGWDVQAVALTGKSTFVD